MRSGALAVLCGLILALCPSLACGQGSRAAVSPDQTLVVSLAWRGATGSPQEREVASFRLGDVAGQGLWVAFEPTPEGGGHRPGVAVDGTFHAVDVRLEELHALELVVAWADHRERSLLFDRARSMGTRGGAPDNVYHLLVLGDFVAGRGPALDAHSVPREEWRGAFDRTRRLALSYALESDARTHEHAGALDVDVHLAGPRMVMAAEEWVMIQTGAAPQSCGLFGCGALGELTGSEEPEQKLVPVYALDVVRNDVEARGAHAHGFQVARSLENDVLEGETIWKASPAKEGGPGGRRVLTASIVLSQLERNRAERGSRNELVRLSGATRSALRGVELEARARAHIGEFLAAHPESEVWVPRRPVQFYEERGGVQHELYAVTAWMQVDPTTGRMVGVLPSGARGALSDEIAGRLQGAARERLPMDSPVANLFRQVAGMYVASGGVLDAVNLTLADPSLAAMPVEEWTEFVAKHSLAYCAQFLEDHADDYDSIPARLAFWQGAILLPSLLGGEEAASEGAQRAWDSMADQAKQDAKDWLEEQASTGNPDLDGLRDELVGQALPELQGFADGLEAAERASGRSGSDWGGRVGSLTSELRSLPAS